MPSFNGNNNDEYSSSIRVGSEHQATIPDIMPDYPLNEPLRESIVWSPDNNLNDSQLNEFIKLAKEKHNYNTEQAYALLYSNKFDLQQCLSDLPLYHSNLVDFSPEEKLIYNTLYGQHRKDFSNYMSFLPNRTTKELIMYYYLNKMKLSSNFPKKRKNQSRARDDSDRQMDYKKLSVHKREPLNCLICLKTDSELFKTRIGNLCRSCFDQRKLDSSLDEIYLEEEEYGSPKSDHCEELDDFAENLADLNEAGINNLNMNTQEIDRKIREIQVEVLHKQEKISTDFGSPIPNVRIVPRWSEDDIAIMPSAIKEYGTDMKKIAQLLGNKNEEQVRAYILANKEKLLPDELKDDMDVDLAN